MRVACLGNRSSLNPARAGMFARDHPRVAHHQLWPRKPGELSHFRVHRHRRHLRDPTQRLQPFDHRTLGSRHTLHRFIDRSLQPHQTLLSVVHLMPVVDENHLLCWTLQTQTPQPLPAALDTPGAARTSPADAAPEARPSWPPLVPEPDPSTPRHPPWAPTPPSTNQSGTSEPASWHHADPS